MRSLLLVALLAPPALGQPFDVPKAIPPDADTLKTIEAKRAELAKALAAFRKSDDDPGYVPPDVEVYAKAAEWVVRHGEWFTKDSGKQTLAVLDAGLARAKAAAAGKTPWREVRGRPVVRGYRSSVDGSVQPYCVTIPEGFKTGDGGYRLDVLLHGRGATLSEVSFIAGKEAAKPAPPAAGAVILEPYGRGNNAYRWAGETDVHEAVSDFTITNVAPQEGVQPRFRRGPGEPARTVLRGFSMGGAGVWHLGLHDPFRYAVLGPGAGFTTTVGKVKFDAPPPDYIQKCLRIYDSVDYAENVFNVPVVAYSGANDPQKAAADNIEAALKGFKMPFTYTHLVAPGLEHKFPPEWQAKAETEFTKVMPAPDAARDHTRFVTYTPRYGGFGDGFITALERQYEKAVVESRRPGLAQKYEGDWVVTTTNVRGMSLSWSLSLKQEVVIDGQRLTLPLPVRGIGARQTVISAEVRKRDGKWEVVPDRKDGEAVPPPVKGVVEDNPIQGPIDDAFLGEFTVYPPFGLGWHPATDLHTQAAMVRFAGEWDKYLRGRLPMTRVNPYKNEYDPGPRADGGHAVLFGDPGSNPRIAEVVGKLPITWTRDRLVVNGVEYDPKTHVPVLICPHPDDPSHYVVINSGHTFRAKDFQGTNALLYPRLGDWAVLKPTPTEKDPAAAEVVAAGLFDENWQFPKK